MSDPAAPHPPEPPSELTGAQRLGFFTEHTPEQGATFAQAHAALQDLAGQAAPFVDDEGYSWRIGTHLVDEAAQRLAWMEWRMRERGSDEDHDHYLKALWADGSVRMWRIDTGNGYYGRTVHALDWRGDAVVLVYASEYDNHLARMGSDGRVHCTRLMDVRFQTTPADVLQLHQALYRPAWGARHWGRFETLRLVLAGATLLTLVMLLIKLFTRNKLGVDPVGWEAVAGAWLGGAVAGGWWARQRSTVPPTGSPVYRPMTLSLEPTGLRWQGDGFESQVDWRQVSELREVGGCLLLTTRLEGTHLVPLRAFSSPQAAADFLAQAQALRELAMHPPPHQPLERLRYRLTRADVAAFFALKREPQGWRKALVYLFLLPCMAVAVHLAEGADDTVWWAGLALGAFSAWALARLVLFVDRRQATARHPLPDGDTELQRWEDHLCVLADGHSAQVAYGQIGNVVAGEQHVFILTAPDKAVIVPRQAFASADDMRRFAQQIDQASRDSAA